MLLLEAVADISPTAVRGLHHYLLQITAASAEYHKSRFTLFKNNLGATDTFFLYVTT